MSDPRQSTPFGHTVSADLVQGLVECASCCGVSIANPPSDGQSHAKTQAAWVPPRYSLEYLLDLWERVTRLSGDPLIGFRMAQVATLKVFGMLGQLLMHCSTVFEAYQLTERYSAIAVQGPRVSVTRDASTFQVSVAPARLLSGDVEYSIKLWVLTNLSLLPQRIAGADAPRPSVVECALPSPGADAIRVLREQLPFRFDAPTHRVVFPARAGDVRSSFADEDLKLLLAQVIEQHLNELGPADSFEVGLAAVLRTMLNGTIPTLGRLSARAGMSQRTLQRRLAESSTSFQRLLREVLREVSDELLARGTYTQREIAFLLGYSEESAFSHAYRSWTGHPPGSHRVRAGIHR